MNKSDAIRKVNKHVGDGLLNHSNTHFSNINTRYPVWWFTFSPEKLRGELHILLAKNPGLIWLRIKANAIPHPESVFRVRPDNGLIHWEIAISGDRYLQDVIGGGTGYDFRPHIEYEWDED